MLSAVIDGVAEVVPSTKDPNIVAHVQKPLGWQIGMLSQRMTSQSSVKMFQSDSPVSKSMEHAFKVSGISLRQGDHFYVDPRSRGNRRVKDPKRWGEGFEWGLSTRIVLMSGETGCTS